MFAAPASTVLPTVGQQVFPGQNQPYSIQVNNSGLPIAGETINAGPILLPTQGTGVTNGAAPIVGPGTWTATRVSNGTLQSILFKGAERSLLEGTQSSPSLPMCPRRPAVTGRELFRFRFHPTAV